VDPVPHLLLLRIMKHMDNLEKGPDLLSDEINLFDTWYSIDMNHVQILLLKYLQLTTSVTCRGGYA
jgi:hypothetical protein